MTLPLSYSRLRLARSHRTRRIGVADRSIFPSPRPFVARDDGRAHPQSILSSTASVFRDPPASTASCWSCPAETRERAKAGGEGRIRTFEALGRQIYSLLRLTASLPRRVSRAAAWPASDVPSDALVSPRGRTVAPVRARMRASCQTRRRPETRVPAHDVCVGRDPELGAGEGI